LDDRIDEENIYESDRESSDYREDEEEDEEVNNLYSQKSRNTDRDATDVLDHLINNVLSDEQRIALRNGECFFCKKKGHFYCTCPARKIYFGQGRKTGMATRKNFKSKPTTSSKTRKPFQSKKKKRDPNAMVYQIEDDEADNLDEFSEAENF